MLGFLLDIALQILVKACIVVFLVSLRIIDNMVLEIPVSLFISENVITVSYNIFSIFLILIFGKLFFERI